MSAHAAGFPVFPVCSGRGRYRVNFAADRILVDYILFCTLDVDLDINPNEVSDARYVSKAELEGMFADDCEWRRFPNLRSFLFAGNHATRRVVELVKTA